MNTRKLKLLLTILTLTSFGPIHGQSSFIATQDNNSDTDGQIGLFTTQKTILDSISNSDEQEKEKRIFQISFLPFFGTNSRGSNEITNNTSINILAGYAYGLKGFEAGGLLNIIKDSVTGVQLAGLGNLVGGDIQAVQMAGLFNIGGNNFKGTQMAGLLNWATDSVNGGQIAGLLNASSSLEGFQTAGLLNLAPRVKGIQIAGLVNIAQETEGTQISGLINYTKTLKGLQIGFINISDTIEQGVAIGFFNYVKHGFHQFEISNSDAMHANLSFKTGTHEFYSILTAGYRLDDINPLWSYGYGIGRQFNFGTKLYANIEVTSQQVNTVKYWTDGLNLLNDLNLNIGVNYRKISVNAGPVLHVNVSKSYDADSGLWGYFNPSNPIFENTGTGTNVKAWIGYRAAFRF
ncbi:MAG: hypothetical protein JKY54_06605 [Flavobacteriales bacterium]|nr:hypothetical protein [Flavobacteriales bacterium]